MATIDGVEVREIIKVERASQHIHIRGLGLSPTLDPSQVADGMAGQMQARRAAGVIVKMIKEGKIAGRAILINGPVGSGKTAIAMGIAKELGEDTPFVALNGSEVFSKEVSHVEALVQGFRKAVAIKIKEETEVLEGEVVFVEIDRPATGAGPKVGKMTLKTADMESVYELGSKMVDMCIKEQIKAGDVVQVDKANGRITRLGRCFNRQHDYDAMGPSVKLVEQPQGEIQKHRETVHTVSLHDIDVINSRAKGYEALFTGDTGEISSEVREQINKKICEWREEGKAAVIPGVLFIDEVHMLTLRCFSFLNRLIEGEISPLLIVATNQKGLREVRDSVHKAPMGVPRDFLDRSLLIKTRNYSYEEYRQIILIRAQEEEINLSYGLSRLLADTAYRCGLRYALQLLTLAERLRSRDPSAQELAKPHVVAAIQLFSDVSRAQATNLQRRIQFATIKQQSDLNALKERATAKLIALPGPQNARLRAHVLEEARKTATEIKEGYVTFIASLNSRSQRISNRMTELSQQCKLDAVRCGHTGTIPPATIIF